ncbi:hypothetical protein F4861DRAFT_522550 [Xylaria intraflava]|nr:hypothetical protein F4861DRAFT_522550 [Xylaria intraflava]
MRFTTHPQAKFDPIPPDLDLHALVDQVPNFDWVTRISLAQLRRLGPVGFEKLVHLHVIEGGRPLVIEGWDRALPKDLFSATWLEETYDKKRENVRDITEQTDIPMTTGHYLRSMHQLTNQWTPTNFRDERRQRLYLKDIDCPDQWFQHLKKIIPPNVFYMNENISENTSHRPRDDDIFDAPEKAPAIAGDLMSSLDPEMRAQNLMCYIGHEGTYTPAHQEMCASLGQNIMVEASGDENGEKPGSSIWFMTETKDREVVREYFLSMLGHDVEIEKHFAQINAWKRANFPVYIVEQKVGDFILVPPLAPHQVWNRGTRTMKVAWNRTTVETIELALHEALPKARLVCRDEQYKNKAVVYYTLNKYYKELRSLEGGAEVSLLGLGSELTQNSVRVKQMVRDFKKLFGLFTEVLVSEMFGDKQTNVEFVPFDSNITCSYCRSNIFNRFLTCKSCVRQLADGEEDTYDVCMECYAMGRSCVCVSGLQWCEQWKWSDLVDQHETWRAMVVEQDGFVDINTSPQPFELARKLSGKKSVAQICQEQLRKRPWNDITKPPDAPSEESDEQEVDDNGRIRRKPRKGGARKKKGKTANCHVCSKREHNYKLAFCTTCPSSYCYGVLWRAFDMMPQAVMEKENWQCPKCLKICNCGGCRQAGNTEPYIPKGTLLGHDTRPIADDRSVESIVDFRGHNLIWLKVTGEADRSKDSKRMNRLRQQADAAKAKDPLASLEDDGVAHETDTAPQDAIMSGYDDESLFVSQDSRGGNVHHNPPTSHEEPGNQAEIADMSGLQDAEGNSVYPDPSGSADPTILNRGRMMGMGFYDQDGSTDRILFDVFQVPTAEALNSEPQVSDFVRKTLRLAKRKARLEQDDDPDFKGPTNHRKKPRTGNIEQLVNLDPALLGTLSDMGPTRNGEIGLSYSSTQIPTAAEEQGEDQSMESSTPDPLRLSLRHAKPMASYVEAEEPLDDPDDTVGLSNTYTENNGSNPEPERSAVDLAADAVRSLTGGISAPQQELNAQPTPQPTGKRRGRPPRNPAGANASSNATVAKSPTSPKTATLPKKRGRPSRSSLATNSLADTEPSQAERSPRNAHLTDVSPADMEPSQPEQPAPSSLARDLSPADTESSQLERPPQDSVATDSPPARKERGQRERPTRSSRIANSSPAGKKPKQREQPPQSPRGVRRSSRAAASSVASPAETKATPEPPKRMESMSLRERLALRGKKNIRIRGRNPTRASGSPGIAKLTSTTTQKRDTSTTPTTFQRPDASDTDMGAKESRRIPKRDQANSVDGDNNSEPRALEDSPSVSSESEHNDSPSPPQASRKRDGPTIVRFASPGDDSSADSGADSYDDKPRRRPAPTRGRGRPSRWPTRGRA